MQNYNNDFQTVDSNSFFELAVISSLGDREEQQDAVGFEIRGDEGLVTVCDGMGGMNGGRLASGIAVDMLLRRYCEEYPVKSPAGFMADTAVEADLKISSLTDDDGGLLQAGSTLTAVIIRKRQLYWLSVGDSRIYLFRNGELARATEDHIYQTVLDEQRAAGLITEDEYIQKSHWGEALVSFLGIGGLPKTDGNDTPFELLGDDMVLMMSDGLYKLLPDREIANILLNFSNISDALNALELKAQRAAKNMNIKRDNMTVALIKIK